MTGKIFISYRREDSSWFTGRIYDRLAKHFSEKQLFIDIDSIAPGDDFINYIEESVNNCDILLAVIGQRWLETIQSKSQEVDFVRLEISAALKNNIRVIPILVENTKMPLDNDLPDELKPLTRKNAFFVNLVSFNSETETLVQTLKKFFLQKEVEIKQEIKLGQVEEEPVLNQKFVSDDLNKFNPTHYLNSGSNNKKKNYNVSFWLMCGGCFSGGYLIWRFVLGSMYNFRQPDPYGGFWPNNFGPKNLGGTLYQRGLITPILISLMLIIITLLIIKPKNNNPRKELKNNDFLYFSISVSYSIYFIILGLILSILFILS